jgi:hypothetical protein
VPLHAERRPGHPVGPLQGFDDTVLLEELDTGLDQG